MAGIARPLQVDLRFGNTAREFKNFGGSPLACYFTREIFGFCRKDRIRKDG
jgi:hypothetical protein